MFSVFLFLLPPPRLCAHFLCSVPEPHPASDCEVTSHHQALKCGFRLTSVLLPSEVEDLFSLSQATRDGFAPGLGVGTANNRVALCSDILHLDPPFVALPSDVALKVLELMILKVFSTLDLSKSAQCRSGRGHKKGEDEHSGAATAGRCVAPCVEHREQTYMGCLRAQPINLASCTLSALPAPWPCHHSPARGEVLPAGCTKPQQANSIAYARVVGPRVSPGSELH